MLNRREFCAFLSAAAAAGVLAPHAAARRRQSTEFHVAELRPGVWVFSEGDRMVKNSGNAVLIATKDGPVLIDTKFATMASEFAAIISKTGNGAPKMVINTHHHPDHAGGNFVFKSAGAEIVAQANLKPRLKALLDERIRPSMQSKAKELSRLGKEDDAQAMQAAAERFTVADFAPDREFDRELAIERGRVKMMLKYFGNAHTDNDCVIHLPELNVLHAGDLLFHRMHAFIDRSAKATTVGWQKALDEAAKLCDAKTIVVAGHGEVTDISAFKLQRDYFDQLREVVQSAIKDGKSRDDICKLQPEVFKDLGNTQLRDKCIGAMYDEIKEGTGTAGG